jgi:hypothetical protein
MIVSARSLLRIPSTRRGRKISKHAAYTILFEGFNRGANTTKSQDDPCVEAPTESCPELEARAFVRSFEDWEESLFGLVGVLAEIDFEGLKPCESVSVKHVGFERLIVAGFGGGHIALFLVVCRFEWVCWV